MFTRKILSLPRKYPKTYATVVLEAGSPCKNSVCSLFLLWPRCVPVCEDDGRSNGQDEDGRQEKLRKAKQTHLFEERTDWKVETYWTRYLKML